MRGIVLVGIVSAALVNAQSFSVGGIGGAPFEDVVNSVSTTGLGGVQSVAKSVNFTLGPAFQFSLPHHLRLEVDALFRPYSFSLATRTSATDISAKQWRFPALLQYRFGKKLVKPFIEGGLSFDHLSGLTAAARSIASGTGQLLHQSDAGVVLGGGLEVQIPLLFRVSGELRYTRQTLANFAGISNLNQAEVLVGVHF